MDDTTATEANAPTIAPEEDLEARVQAIEAEKAKLAEEKENYRKAYLKEVERQHSDDVDEEKLRRIAREELENSRVSQLDKEKDEIIKRALKENRELKLAHLNKSNTPPAAIGSHNESVAVRDTLVTPEQMALFKAKGWTDQDIERYKKNLRSKI